MAALNRVSIGETSSPEVALYIGQLEASISNLIVTECKYRAILEMVTGEAWDSTDLVGDAVNLKDVAAEIIIKQTGLTTEQAQELIAERTSPDATQQLSNPVNQTASLSMPERIQRWAERNAAKKAAAQEEPSTT